MAIINSILNGFRKGYSQETTDYQNWERIAIEIGSRVKRPFNSPTYLMYFFGLITLMGGIGVFTTIYSELKNGFCFVNHWNIAISFGTYFIALIASSSADIILTSQPEQKELKAFGIILILLGIMLFILITITQNAYSYIFAICGTFLSLFSWWIANANNDNLHNKVQNKDIVPDATEIKGDIEAFKLQ